MNPVINTRY